MALILRILTGLIGLIALLAVIGLALPKVVSVVREITIDAPGAEIFPYVNSLQAAEAWSPWLDRDPDVQITHSGPETGTGARMVWTSDVPEVGNGTQEITASHMNERVETALDFGTMGTAAAYFTLVPEGTATRVTWGFSTDTGYNPMSRWFGLMMDTWVGGDYELGLERLKQLVESS